VKAAEIGKAYDEMNISKSIGDFYDEINLGASLSSVFPSLFGKSDPPAEKTETAAPETSTGEVVL